MLRFLIGGWYLILLGCVRTSIYALGPYLTATSVSAPVNQQSMGVGKVSIPPGGVLTQCYNDIITVL